MAGTYRRQAWTQARKLTLRMSAINRMHQAEFVDDDGRPWSQAQVDQAIKCGRMKLVQERKTRNRAGVIIGRTLTVRVRPTVRQRRRAA